MADDINKVLPLVGFAILVPVFFIGYLSLFAWVIKRIMQFYELYVTKYAKENSDLNLYWPKFDSVDTAIYVSRSAALVSIFIALVMCAVTLFNNKDFSLLDYTDPIFFVLIGFGLWRLSILAVYAGMIIYISSMILSIINNVFFVNIVIVVLISLSFINGYRAIKFINNNANDLTEIYDEKESQ